ncbi:hypothetical protein ACIQBJ_13890 [Kitasatospora sp. NPDC088391]|uniref:hypothetical protein n=1 Tax=Kitasatospora sp. NPDC088391 TaxID=3364074 RepID=UPI0037F84BF4
MESHPSAYEARYGWYRRSVLGAFFSLFPTAVVALQAPVWCAVLAAVFTGGIGFVTTVVVAGSRRVAVRVDDRGVVLGRVPLPTGSRTQTVAWEDIELIRVHHLRMGNSTKSRGQYLSLQQRSGAPSLHGHPDFLRPAKVAALLPPASKRLSWCELDPARLRAAVTAFAPEVRLVVED